MLDFDEIIDKFCKQEKISSFEGRIGVINLEKILLAIGYDDFNNSVVENFLTDNPGAIETIVEWIRSVGDKTDWKEMIESEILDSDENDEEEDFEND